jgi:hypothetical protein
MTDTHGQSNNSIENNQRLRRGPAARYLGIESATLARWAVFNKGPRFHRVSARCVVYDVADLDAFIAACPTGGGSK